MGSRKTLGVARREQTRTRRARARANGICVVCFTAPSSEYEHCDAGIAGGVWCTAAPEHEHTIRHRTTCADCRARKYRKRAGQEVDRTTLYDDLAP